jgi:hypothetical protein
MPIPPQENAPSLSPGQSFSCQSPLPWVTGTDWTGSLRALWQLQGSFQEFSPSHVHSLTWRESLTCQKASCSPVLRSLNNPMGKQTQAFQKLDSAITGWLHSHGFRTGNARIGSLSFPEQAKTLPRIQHRLLVSWGYMHGISQNRTQTFQSQGLPKVLYRSRVSHTAQSFVRVQTLRWNGNRNLLTAHPGRFIRMHQG